MKDKINNILNKIKNQLTDHKKIFKRLSIGFGVMLGVVIISIVVLYIYLKFAYPSEIVIEGAFTDISNIDFAFSDRDLDASYDINEAIEIRDAIIPTDCTEISSKQDKIVFNAAGTYILSGDFTDKMLFVSIGEQDKIQLVLNNCIIQNSAGPAIYIESADKIFLTMPEGTVNTISDGSDYEYTDEESNLDGAIFSRADLTLNGSGKLVIKGNNKHGIVSKDDLIIGGGEYDITSVKKGISGKDCVKIYDCDMNINAGSDGIAATNSEEASKGFVYIEKGNLNIQCGNDGIQAETVIKLEKPNITVCTGGGSVNAPVRVEKFGKNRDQDVETSQTNENEESVKGLKAGTDLLIIAGNYSIDSYDDSIHANNSIQIDGGTFMLKSGDDAIHADNTLLVLNGDVLVESCFEGLEAYQIAISGGKIIVTSSDDGINASGELNEDNLFDAIKLLLAPQVNGKLEITGGTVAVNTEGDGLDSNGVMTISGGKTYIAGPASNRGNGAFDCTWITIDVPEVEEGDSFVIEITKEEFATKVENIE